MATALTKPARRLYALGVTNCHTATTLAATVELDQAEEANLRDALGRLFEYGLLLPAYLQPAKETLGFDAVVAELDAFVGAPFVGAALQAGGAPFVETDPLPAGLMAVWPFEPEAGSADVVLSSGRLWGADFLIEGLRVDSGTESGVVPGVEARFARWAAAAGRKRFMPMPLPGHRGCYAVFASLTPDD